MMEELWEAEDMAEPSPLHWPRGLSSGAPPCSTMARSLVLNPPSLAGHSPGLPKTLKLWDPGSLAGCPTLSSAPGVRTTPLPSLGPSVPCRPPAPTPPTVHRAL